MASTTTVGRPTPLFAFNDGSLRPSTLHHPMAIPVTPTATLHADQQSRFTLCTELVGPAPSTHALYPAALVPSSAEAAVLPAVGWAEVPEWVVTDGPDSGSVHSVDFEVSHRIRGLATGRDLGRWPDEGREWWAGFPLAADEELVAVAACPPVADPGPGRCSGWEGLRHGADETCPLCRPAPRPGPAPADPVAALAAGRAVWLDDCSYRQLQAMCKARGLKAVGKRADLEARLLA